jgi:hypothetical protein
MNRIRVFIATYNISLDIVDTDLESYIADNYQGLGSTRADSIVRWYHRSVPGDTIRVYDTLAIVKL